MCRAITSFYRADPRRLMTQLRIEPQSLDGGYEIQ
jgi:hypothetical protein